MRINRGVFLVERKNVVVNIHDEEGQKITMGSEEEDDHEVDTFTNEIIGGHGKSEERIQLLSSSRANA
jgi:hypothetical protein